MTIEEMRSYISNAYSGDKWKDRCGKMHRNQVIAIYHAMQSRKRDKDKQAFQTPKKSTEGVQMTIYDFL